MDFGTILEPKLVPKWRQNEDVKWYVWYYIFDRFWDRFLIDFGMILRSKLVPKWRQNEDVKCYVWYWLGWLVGLVGLVGWLGWFGWLGWLVGWLPCLALPCLALPSSALQWLALPCLSLPFLALPCLALHCLALPWNALPCLHCLASPSTNAAHQCQLMFSYFLSMLIIHTCISVLSTSFDHGLLLKQWDLLRKLIKMCVCFFFILPRQLRQRCPHPYIRTVDAAAILGHACSTDTNREKDLRTDECALPWLELDLRTCFECMGLWKLYLTAASKRSLHTNVKTHKRQLAQGDEMWNAHD